ncbi:protein DPCD-like isoform X2 [Ostrea edulis]|uniref:protein DPCD-like isoform X2 n=1 Tax=Ostrea edulis TaxID=37623 RepID=UPI0024AFE8CD|nr:protein DPCD-like isoform X2 [Ostrea edulis]
MPKWDRRRKIHFVFPDGTEMAEEYDIKSSELVLRKWRRRATLGVKESKWEFEVGEDLLARNVDSEGLLESAANPIFARKDTLSSYQWRIRNLPYSIETYNVTVEPENRTITVRTTNKKYFKKISIPDMDRVQFPLQQSALSIAHANNTLIVTYKKPKEILQMEKEIQEEFKKLKASKDGDVDCTPS